jgi:biotin carboxylase
MEAMESGVVLLMGMVRRGECESLARRGLPLGVLVDTNNKQRLADVSGFRVVERFDFSRPLPDLIAAVRDIQNRVGIRCLYNVIELYVAQTAEVAAALGFPGISPSAARLCLDKNLMRGRFHERIGPRAGARFHEVTSEPELVDLADRLGYPVFLQPSNVSASMWASRNESTEVLVRNYRAILDEVPRYYQRLGQKEKRLGVVLAEYLEGQNTSIDCVVDRQGRVLTTPIVDVLTGRDIGIDDYHHFARILPSRVTEDEGRELARLAVEGVLALDMRCAAAHVEFIGPRLGEIAARPGGNRPRILELAYGMDELHAYYQVLRGDAPSLSREHDRAAAILTPFPARNGTLRQIRHLDRLTRIPGYLYHEVRSQPGQPAGLARGGYRAPLYIELCSSDPDLVRRGVEEIASWRDLYEVD